MSDSFTVPEVAEEFRKLISAKDAEIERLKQMVTKLANALLSSSAFIHAHCCDVDPTYAQLIIRARDLVMERREAVK